MNIMNVEEALGKSKEEKRGVPRESYRMHLKNYLSAVFINNTFTILEAGAREKDLIFRKTKAYKLIFCKLI